MEGVIIAGIAVLLYLLESRYRKRVEIRNEYLEEENELLSQMLMTYYVDDAKKELYGINRTYSVD